MGDQQNIITEVTGQYPSLLVNIACQQKKHWKAFFQGKECTPFLNSNVPVLVARFHTALCPGVTLPAVATGQQLNWRSIDPTDLKKIKDALQLLLLMSNAAGRVHVSRGKFTILTLDRVNQAPMAQPLASLCRSVGSAPPAITPPPPGPWESSADPARIPAVPCSAAGLPDGLWLHNLCCTVNRLIDTPKIKCLTAIELALDMVQARGMAANVAGLELEKLGAPVPDDVRTYFLQGTTQGRGQWAARSIVAAR